MGTVASQITKLTIVYSIVYSDTDQRKHQSSASLAFVRFTGDRWIPRTNGQLRGKCFHLMTSSCAFCLHHMLQCRPVVAFLSLATWVWSYHICNGNGVYLGHNTCLGAVFLFTKYTHRSYMKFAQSYVTRTRILCKLWSNLLHLFKNNWKTDRLMEGWTDGARRDHTIYDREQNEKLSMNTILYQYSTMRSTGKAQNIGMYKYNIFQPAYVFTRRQVSLDSIIRIWYTVRTSW